MDTLIDLSKYMIVGEIDGHVKSVGREAGKEKNQLWKVINKETTKEMVLMYCETNTICVLCPESYRKIIEYENTHNDKKKLTFFKMQNGYIGATNKLYIHQIITGCYGNGKGTKEISVDHIDQNPLNNTIENLRIATREEQEQNSKGIKEGTKRARKHNAKPLPEGITQDMLGKYVTYYHEFIDKEKTKSREFFKIEKHPKLDKLWIGSKSNKIPILIKLAAVNKVTEDLKRDVYPTTTHEELPKYITIKVERDKPHMIFDKKNEDGTRLNLRMVLSEDYNVEEHLKVFKEKIKAKYDFDIE